MDAWPLLRAPLFRMDPERAHGLVLGALERAPRLSAAVLRRLAGPRPAGLEVRVGPLTFPAPVGLAAGMDKDGQAVGAWAAMGFGWVELGTVTARPQPGNARPRLFRLVDERALVNRMGFNNAGAAALAERLRRLRGEGIAGDVPVGANVGKSRVVPLADAAADYLESVRILRGVVDWITVNVSSPNTPGLRRLQRAEALSALLGAIVPEAAPTPVLLKLSPDLEPADLRAAVDVAVDAGCAAVVATNTTRRRPGRTSRLHEEGGLSGAPLWPLARARIGQVLDAAGERIAVVGVGGISRAEQVRELLDAGCAAVQLLTALVYEGPLLPARLHRALAAGGGPGAAPARGQEPVQV